MKQPLSARAKIAQILRIDRALRLVWQAGKKWTLCSLGIIVVQGILPLFGLYLMKLIVDAVSTALGLADKSPATFHTIFLLICLAGLVAILTVLFQQLATWIREAQSLAVTDHVYRLLHQKSVALDLEYFENAEHLDTLHRAQEEGPYRPTHLLDGLLRVGQNGVSLAAVAGLLFTFHWSIPLILLGAAAPGMIVRIGYSGKLFRLQQRHTQADRKSRYYHLMLTGDVHAKEIRLFGLAELFIRRFSRLRKTLRSEKVALVRQRSLAEFMPQVFATFIIFFTFAIIAKRAIDGGITLGDMVMFFQAFQRGLANMKDFLGGLAGLYEDSLFLTNLYAFLDLKPTIKQPGSPVPVPEPIKEGIHFSHVHFSYPGGRKVLQDISFTVAPGEVIALVGENGSGKSTLIKLLCRLYDPDDGKISIDGIDLKAFGIKSLQSGISVVFQDFVKYFFSAGDNITFGNVSRRPDPAALSAAAQKADVDDLINSLPDGYDTVLGKWFENGEELSSGQWQKMALARAFYRDAPIIVLDEPASSLDIKTEHDIFSRFYQLMEGKSAILISHRLATVTMADRILVMKQGRIVEQGSHEELMRINGEYAGLFRIQSARYRETGGLKN